MRAAFRGLTMRGRALLAAGLAAVTSSVLFGQPDLLRIGVLLVAVVVGSLLVVARTRYRLVCHRLLTPARVAAGSEARVTVRLDNASRFPSGLLLLEDHVPYVLGSRPRFVVDRIEPRGTREVSYPVRSDVRGRFAIGPLGLRLTDPFGLCELGRAFRGAEPLVVTPVVHPLAPVPLGGEWSGGGDSRTRSLASAGEDDAATREYRQGDDLRRVHWRSTARRGELMVRREEQPWQARCTLLLDTRARAHRGEGPGSSFEWAVSAAASVGLHLAHRGYAVHVVTDSGAGLTSAISDTMSVTGSVTGLAAADFEGLLLDALAVIGLGAGQSLNDGLLTVRRGGGHGLVIAILGDLDLDQAGELARLRHANTVGLALLLRTPDWSASGSRAEDQRRADGAATLLRQTGWRVVPVGPADSVPDAWARFARIPAGAGMSRGAR